MRFLLLFLLFGCKTTIEQKRQDADKLRSSIKIICSCHGGYYRISYETDIRILNDGYKGAGYYCNNGHQGYIFIEDEVTGCLK